MAVAPSRHTFNVDEYHRMAEAGIFHEDDRLELIEGEIIEMVPIGVRHAAAVNRLTNMLVTSLGNRAVVAVQNPLRLGRLSEPQPDLALLRPREDFYSEHHPAPEDTLLVIEVADTSGAFDRQVKTPLYARSAIGEVWIVDLVEHFIESYRAPGPNGYGEVNRAELGRSIAPAAFPDLVFQVKDLLGEKPQPI